MSGLPVGTRIWLAAGITDMRAGMNGLAAKVDSALKENPTCRFQRASVVERVMTTQPGRECSLSHLFESGPLRLSFKRRTA